MTFIESLIQQMPLADVFEIILYAGGSILSIVLTVLSISAYLRSGLKNLQYAIIAFSLFSGFLIYENLEHQFEWDNAYTDIVIPLMGLAILVFFFMAVTKRATIDNKISYNK